MTKLVSVPCYFNEILEDMGEGTEKIVKFFRLILCTSVPYERYFMIHRPDILIY